MGYLEDHKGETERGQNAEMDFLGLPIRFKDKKFDTAVKLVDLIMANTDWGKDETQRNELLYQNTLNYYGVENQSNVPQLLNGVKDMIDRAITTNPSAMNKNVTVLGKRIQRKRLFEEVREAVSVLNRKFSGPSMVERDESDEPGTNFGKKGIIRIPKFPFT